MSSNSDGRIRIQRCCRRSPPQHVTKVSSHPHSSESAGGIWITGHPVSQHPFHSGAIKTLPFS